MSVLSIADCRYSASNPIDREQILQTTPQLLSIINYQLSIINYQLSIINYYELAIIRLNIHDRIYC